MTLKHCPTEFYINCQASGKRCGICRGKTGNPTNKLYYVPTNNCAEWIHHPASDISKPKIVKDQKAKQRTRAAHKAERAAGESLEKSIGLKVRFSQRSGAVNGDGDFHIDELNLQIDHKQRTTTGSLGITRAEYLKGKSQGTEAWVITSGDGETTPVESVVVLRLECFKRLVYRGLDGNHDC
jgi:hypothetical protein